ncbi:hypothetical protein KY331_04485, partial [Candidatus Woesearchaeota archaeon]|nr:hypothetical protein [Candidatus Woesearchaeota archaeon]
EFCRIWIIEQLYSMNSESYKQKICYSLEILLFFNTLSITLIHSGTSTSNFGGEKNFINLMANLWPWGLETEIGSP